MGYVREIKERGLRLDVCMRTYLAQLVAFVVIPLFLQPQKKFLWIVGHDVRIYRIRPDTTEYTQGPLYREQIK